MDYVILKNERIAETCYRLTLDLSKTFLPPIPGQFYSIRCTDTKDPLLRRPFSMHRVAEENGLLCLQILYRVVGKGTEWLSTRKPGEALDLLEGLERYMAEHGLKDLSEIQVPKTTSDQLTVIGYQ